MALLMQKPGLTYSWNKF